MSESFAMTYDERLAEVAAWYLEHPDPDSGGWPMRWGETIASTKPASLLGTAYGLGVIRYARTSVADERVQRALAFVLDRERHKWLFTRHPVYSILAATEWPEALVAGGMGERASISTGEVHAVIEAAVKWLEEAQSGPGLWPNSRQGHACIAWSAKVLYALGRLRQRSEIYRNHPIVLALTQSAGEQLVKRCSRLPGGATTGAWPACGPLEAQSVTNTALAVIALSHRAVESAAPALQIESWRGAYQDGARWLVRHHDLWDSNESGEHDRLADDGWQFAVWSLAPRACLSAGLSPSNPRLASGFDFAFERWRGGERPGWYIRGDGVSGYSNWSVAQLGQVAKLAIARLDPLDVLRALQNRPEVASTAADLTIVLDVSSRTAEVHQSGRPPETLNLVRQEKRFLMLEAFAVNEVPVGGMLDSKTVDDWINRDGAPMSWEALKGLAHQVNESTRELLDDPTVQVFRTISKSQRAIIAGAQCEVRDHDPEHLAPVLLEDVTGISASTGESY